MSTLNTTNIKHPSSASNNIVLDSSGGVDLDALTVSGSAPADSVNIDSSGRVGIGTTSPQSLLSVLGSASTKSGIALGTVSQNLTESRYIGICNGTDNTNIAANSGFSGIEFGGPNSTDEGYLAFHTHDNGVASGERARIDKAGRLLVGTTTTAYAALIHAKGSLSDYLLALENTNAGPYGIRIRYSAASPNGASNDFLYCDDSTALRFQVRSNGGLANFSANNVNLSDRNAKKDIALAADTWNCLKEWEIVNFRYKDQPDDSDLNMGVIAQQVAESCPEVITVFQEATEDQPKKLGVKDQQMMWMAIKALQEAQVRIEQLETEMAAVKAQLS